MPTATLTKQKETVRNCSFYINPEIQEKDITLDDILSCWPGNQRVFESLVKDFIAEKIIPFIGAGITKDLVMPETPNYSWNDLINELCKQNPKIGVQEQIRINDCLSNEEYEEAAQVLEDVLGTYGLQTALLEHYQNLKLDKTKLEQSPLSILADICKHQWLPQLILTTNYDGIIEEAYQQKGISIDPLVPEMPEKKLVNTLRRNDAKYPVLFKFHGSGVEKHQRDYSHELILSQEAYNRVYGKKEDLYHGRGNDLIRIITMFLLTRPLLFLGCSLKKDRIIDLIKMNEGYHYAFIPCGGYIDDDGHQIFNNAKATEDAISKTKELRAMDIRPIFFPKTDNWICIPKMLNGLHNVFIADQGCQKDKWLEYYLGSLRVLGKIEHIVFFGGISGQLRKGGFVIGRLNEWLTRTPNAKVFFCYESGDAYSQRNNQIEKPRDEEESNIKIAEVQAIPELFSEENKKRIHLIPLLYNLNGYPIVVENDIFWNVITHARSSEELIIKIADDERRRYVNYMIHALEATDKKHSEINIENYSTKGEGIKNSIRELNEFLGRFERK